MHFLQCTMDLKLTYLFGLLALTSFTKATAGENDIVIDQDLLDFLNALKAANIEYSNPPSSSLPPRKISFDYSTDVDYAQSQKGRLWKYSNS